MAIGDSRLEVGIGGVQVGWFGGGLLRFLHKSHRRPIARSKLVLCGEFEGVKRGELADNPITGMTKRTRGSFRVRSRAHGTRYRNLRQLHSDGRAIRLREVNLTC